MCAKNFKGYAKKVAMTNFDKLNAGLPEQLKIYKLGDGRYSIVEFVIENALDQLLSMQDTKKPILYKDVERKFRDKLKL